MSGVVSDKRANTMPRKEMARVHVTEGHRAAVGYECAKQRNVAGMRLAHAKAKPPHTLRCIPLWRPATPRTHPAPERVKAANQQFTALSGRERHTKRPSAVAATATRPKESWIMTERILRRGRETRLLLPIRRNWNEAQVPSVPGGSPLSRDRSTDPGPSQTASL
jgi:hypothetical protein